MTSFALVWIFVAGNSTYQSYSPPVKTQEQCIAMQKSMTSLVNGRCVQVEVLINK
jgi:hypothetical protein